MTDEITLTVDGAIYSGWTEIRITRGLDRVAADFDIAVSERWQSAATPWLIQPFGACTLAIGGDLVLTGYVDSYTPGYDAQSHTVRVAGRSKTMDLIDCTPEIPSGQFKGYKVDAIARSVAALFGIDVMVETGVGDPFPDATLQRSETAFAFLERLCRLRGVLACDDEAGNLVLTAAGGESAAGALVQGRNILRASGKLDAAKRFSSYTVRTQHGITADVEETEVDVVASANDAGCPRFRPYSTFGESQLTQAQAKARARWLAVSSAAKGIQAEITVPGFRQADGSLWRINQRVPVVSPYLQIDRELLVATVEFSLSPAGGRTTRLTLGPVEGYTPDPGQVKLKRAHGSGPSWDGGQKID